MLAARAAALVDGGAKPSDAKRRATDAVIAIQGALVFARATGERQIFDNAMLAMRRSLIAP